MPWKRQAFTGSTLERALNIADLRALAQRRVPHLAFEYLEGGAEDEATLRCNRTAFEDWRLVPRTLVDTRERHLRSELFGTAVAAPLLIAPTGFNGMLDPDGDVALARAAARFDIPFTLSTFSTTRLEDVAARAGGRLWMQLYVMKDRTVARDLVRRAAAAGYEALVFTSDANVFGSREWDRRNFRTPGRPTLRAALDTLRHPRWLAALARSGGLPRLRNLEAVLPRTATSALGGSTMIPQLMDASVTWDDVAWMRDAWPGKLLVKGILDPADAERAAALGCDGIVLSNHGGRQLDSCVAPIEVLPQVAAAVGDRLTVIVDSGFRRGTDICKALAMGANAVCVGRPYIWGLGAFGQPGIERVMELLRIELHAIMQQVGAPMVKQLTPAMVRRVGAVPV